MLNTHLEVEIKIEAEGLDLAEFKRFCIDKGAKSYIFVQGCDYFYVQGENVIRHRVKEDGSSELTVKKRKSKVSTQERAEIDIPLPDSVKTKDVAAFLKLAGFEYTFTLFKKANIFHVNKSGHEFSLVVYTVYSLDGNGMPNNDAKTFLEVEIAKDATTTLENAKRLLREWKQEIQQHFNFDKEPINMSLYEMYSQDLKDKG